MAMGTGAKIAIGCGCLASAGAARRSWASSGMGAWWAKDKLTEATGGLDKMAAKADEIGRWEKKANANPYARPADGVIPEARFVKFLETRKQRLLGLRAVRGRPARRCRRRRRRRATSCRPRTCGRRAASSPRPSPRSAWRR